MLNWICNVSGSDCHHIDSLINSIQVNQAGGPNDLALVCPANLTEKLVVA